MKNRALALAAFVAGITCMSLNLPFAASGVGAFRAVLVTLVFAAVWVFALVLCRGDMFATVCAFLYWGLTLVCAAAGLVLAATGASEGAAGIIVLIAVSPLFGLDVLAAGAETYVLITASCALFIAFAAMMRRRAELAEADEADAPDETEDSTADWKPAV